MSAAKRKCAEMDRAIDYQHKLVTKGFVVIPTPLSDEALRTQARAGITRMLVESPELVNFDPNDTTASPVLGGFSALGHPSSFHHPDVRVLREQLHACILDSDALPIRGRKLERTWDRITYRIPGRKASADSLHRDRAPSMLERDDVFGGWANIDDAPQVFICAPGTHLGVGKIAKGFDKIKDPAEVAAIRPKLRRVEIPPGHAILFYEQIAHEVHSEVAKRLMMRIHLGFRITKSAKPLHGADATISVIEDQGVPRIKSDQECVVFPSDKSNFTRNFQGLTDWSVRTFHPKCLYSHKVKSGVLKDTEWTRVNAKMRSLHEYKLPLHAPYDDHERAIFWPRREWQLRTFESPTKRVRYTSPSASDWELYEWLASSQPVKIRRPCPEAE